MAENVNREYVFVWKIRNYSYNNCKSGEAINSPIFTLENLKKSHWFLRVYPQLEKPKKDFFDDSNDSMHNNSDHFSYESYPMNDSMHNNSDDFSNESYLYLHNNNAKTYVVDWQVRITDNQNNSMTFNFEKLSLGANNHWGFHAPIISAYSMCKEGFDDVLTIRSRFIFASQQNYSEALTKFDVDRESFFWIIRISDILKKVLKKELDISKDSKFEIILKMFQEKIDIVSKKQSVNLEYLTCKISVIDANGKEFASASDEHAFKENGKWKFPFSITKKFVDDNKSAFRDNDTLCLLCKFAAFKTTITETIPDAFNETDTFRTQYQNMLLDSTYSDVKLKVGNKMIDAHKCVLAAGSPVFATMFKQDMVESKTNVVEISDVESDILKLFLKYVYTGKIENLDYETAKKLLLIAEKYEVLMLKGKCVSFLESVLSLWNVFEALRLADMVGSEHLKYAAVDFVAANSEIVISMPEWQNFMQSNTKLATEMISKMLCNKKN